MSATTIERNADQQEQEREQQHEAEHERRRRLHRALKSCDCAVPPPTRVLGALEAADRGGDDRPCAALRARGPRPGRCRCRRAGYRRGRPCRRALSSIWIGFCISPGRERLSPSGRRSPPVRGSRSPPLIATTAAVAPAGERLVDSVECLQLRQALGQRVDARCRPCAAAARGGRGRQAPPAERRPRSAGGGGRASRIAPQTRPVAVVAAEPVQERDASLLDAVAELRRGWPAGR